ncbi:hypothetical protein X798_00779 [Onchocerca flexuosa]|uniref:Uncharacterized protein n=1 Tax=Onchocerca flexuosa TaxID=387005 RepID=A0A238C5N6_9BILA|nr:hypothetical protein X798_00779 [Onchocerca flexuosa]
MIRKKRKRKTKQMNITNLFTDEFDESRRKWEEEICLEPDKSISGGLAFRLCGNKTRGVFIQYVHQKSEQISRKKRCEEGKLSSVSKDENGNFRYCHPINDDLTTSNNDTTLSVSFSDMTGSSEPVIYAQVRNNSLNI